MCMFINRKPCTSPDSNKTLDNIFGCLIIFDDAITPPNELNYFGLHDVHVKISTFKPK